MKPKNWTDEQFNFLKDNYGKLTYKEIGEKLNLSEGWVKKASIKYGIAKKKEKEDIVWTQAEIKILKENYGKLSYKEIHKMIPVHPLSSIQGKANSLGIIDKNKTNWIKKSTNLGKKTIFFDENFFETPNLLNCYWAGFIAADGNIRKDKKELSIQIGDKDYEHLKKFTDALNFAGKISRYTRKNGIAMCNAHFISIKLVDDLEKNFNIVPQKTFKLIPPNIKEKELIDAFMIGYIDGDGCITLRKKYNTPGFDIRSTIELNTWFLKRIEEICEDKINAKLQVEDSAKNHSRFKIQSSKSEKILKYLKKINVPKLQRKWGKII